MRILFIVESAGGGVGRHVVDLGLGLLERGHELHLLYSPFRTDDLFEQGLARLIEKGAKTLILEMQRSPGPTDLQMCLEIKSYIRANGPFDVVHGQSSKGGALSRLAGRHNPAIIVYTPHAIATLNPTMSARKRAFWGLVEKRLASRTDGIICVSEEELKHIDSQGFDADKLFLVHNGVDVPAAPVPESTKTVGFVGRFELQKDPENLIQAFAKVSQTHPDWRLTMVGYGPLQEFCEALCARLGVADKVDWPGARNGAVAMRDFAIFALPSRYEALPYVLLEALGAGKPIVSTNCGGAKTTIADGTNGWIVPIEDSTALANALGSLMDDDSKRKAFAAQSFRKASEFSLDEMVDRTVVVYETLIRMKRGGSTSAVA